MILNRRVESGRRRIEGGGWATMARHCVTQTVFKESKVL